MAMSPNRPLQPANSQAPATNAGPKNLSGALRTVLNILDAWDVPLAARLKMLGCSKSTYFRWLQTRELGDTSRDTLERLSYILGIWKALGILFAQPEMARAWVHRPNADPIFGGAPPLERMSAGQVADLYRVRHFLDGWRG